MSASTPPSDERPWRQTAEELMRSRFLAFKTGDLTWLRATWHPSTRPDDLAPEPDIRWRGVQIVDTVAGGPDDAEGVVEFRATYSVAAPDEAGRGRRPGVMHERSRFVRLHGRWVYLDGEQLD